jgi:hypothetical protein
MPEFTSFRWRLIGYDTFSGQEYPLPGEYDSEVEAVAAAGKRLEELEGLQPSASSGGQNGIQDRVYVVRPDGTIFRVLPE